MADSELQILAKTDRNPGQEARYQQLLTEQGTPFTITNGRANITGFGTGGNNANLGQFAQASSIQQAIEQQRQAAKPAIESLQKNIPLVQESFGLQRQQLTAEKEPLKARYDNLLASIKGNQTTAENRQTLTTGNELARRGISNDSGLYQQELTNAVNPITRDYTGLATDTALQGDKAQRDLTNLIDSLNPQERQQLQAINDAIAQLQSGAASAGIVQGIGQYQFGANQDFQQQQFSESQRQNDIANKLSELNNNRPVFNQLGSNLLVLDPNTGKVINTISGLQNQVGGVPFDPYNPKPTGGGTPTTFKETVDPRAMTKSEAEARARSKQLYG